MKDNCKTITKETYKIIKCWEWDAGESFIEYFGDNCWGINEIELMMWLFDKGYISEYKLLLFRKEIYKTVCDCLCAYEVDYALFPYGECDEEANSKSELLIAEYIVEKGLGVILSDFAFEGKGWASFDSNDDKKRHRENLQKMINNWDEEDDAEYNRILNLSVEDINKRLFEENN